jgi:hypothetical protein
MAFRVCLAVIAATAAIVDTTQPQGGLVSTGIANVGDASWPLGAVGMLANWSATVFKIALLSRANASASPAAGNARK